MEKEIAISFGMTITIASFSLIIGILAGYFFKREDLRKKQLELDAENERKIRQAEKKVHEFEIRSKEIESESQKKYNDIITEAKNKANKISQEIEKKEARIESKEEDLTKKVEEVESQRVKILEKEHDIEEKKKEIEIIFTKQKTELEKIAGMRSDEAIEKLFGKIKQEKEQDLILRMKRAEEEIHEKIEDKSREIIAHAIQKYAADTTSELTITSVPITNDDMKGRIIGREGRNINTFEKITGVDVIVDDTPGVVIISGFDLLRRFIAKKSLEKLIEDGRIHPARIEEVVQKSADEVEKMVKNFGEKAIQETGIAGIPNNLVKILGQLRFRTSYGQNVLQHSIEVAFLSEIIANEIGADGDLAKKAGLLHDIGKAVSHEVSGKHALISGEICRKFGMSEKLINIVEAHHEDVDKESIEAFIIQAADAISASRPGARRETAESYIKRLRDLETLGKSFDGVEKCYAIQAGRELRIIVQPEKISDLQAKELVNSVARKIESDMTYPGEVKVVIFRETRVEGIAK